MTQRLDVVTTALCRPELLDLTYRSFFTRIKDLPEIRIILNVDPLGKSDQAECVRVAKHYSNSVVFRCPDSPGFMGAVKWCYEQVESPVVLHLEDDWLLRRPIDYKTLLKTLLDSRLDQLVFPMKTSRLPCDVRYSFRPHLARAERVCAILESLSVIDGNPEKCLAEHPSLLLSSDFMRGGERLVVDMGRKWAKAQGLKKHNDGDSWFVPRTQSLLAKLEYRVNLARWRSIAFQKT